ncbi:hypothetical protein CSKR_203822 [Clonorchis sinensis]|uniref:Protein kinase domain-containing protein n=2 Tax=Clonorchis sinensis TaxID=79923 RepID=A0A8T1N2G6_CLOSI|nr:hypothetical protein CSKR_203822 [Clonorchis sinensis]
MSIFSSVKILAHPALVDEVVTVLRLRRPQFGSRYRRGDALLKCSVFLFEKYIADKLHKPRRSEIVTHMLKREIKLLMQLKHPNLLHVIWPAEETSDSLAFATEQVSASLANLLGNHTRMPQPIPSEIQNFQFDDMVRKLCLYQLTSTLRFLHSGQALFHNNVSPGSILLTAQSQWRLAGLAFVEIIKDDKCESPRLKFPSSKALASPSCDPGFSPWTRKLPKMARPDTHYAAPECLFLTSGWAAPFGLKRVRPTPEGRAAENESFIEGYRSGKSTKRNTSVSESRTATSGEIPGPWSDMFSLGLLICSLYSVGEPSPHSLCCVAQDRETPLSSHDTKEHKNQPSGECTNAESVSQKDRNPDIIRARQLAVDMQIPELFRKTVGRMPLELVEPVEKMLSRSSQRRPTSQLFALLKFFNDPCLLSLYVLGNFAEKPDDEKYKYLDVVRTHLNEFPKPILYKRIVPMLIDALTSCYSNPISEASKPSFTIDAPKQSPVELKQSVISTFSCILQHSSPREYTEFLESWSTEFVEQCKCTESKTELLVNIYAFTKHASAQSIEQLFVPIVCECLKSRNEEATLAAMESLKEMSAYFQQSDLDDLVLQGILEAYNMNSRQIKVTALTSLCSLVRQISQDALSNRVVPFLLETITSLPMEDPKSPNVYSELSGRDFSQNYNILPNICDVWKEITSSRPMIMEPNLITKHIFPSILTHLLDSDLNLTQFRTVISTLYALLGVLDIAVCGPENNTDNTQYRTIPAVTIDAPGGSDYGDDTSEIGSEYEPNQRNRSPTATPRASAVREAVPFVPMLHPNQLRELQMSPNLPRRASAHVIFPLPMDDSSTQISASRRPSAEKSRLTGTSFLGIKLPSVSNLRRHSYGADRSANTGAGELPQVGIVQSPSTDSRRGSAASFSSRVGCTPKTDNADSFLNSENTLLTARVCEGPFISAPSSRSSSQRRSGSIIPDQFPNIGGQSSGRRLSRNDISKALY